MPVHREFARAMGKLALLGTADLWSTPWKIVLLETPAAKITGTTLYSDLAPLFPPVDAPGWSIQEYVAPQPQAQPPVEEVLPYAHLQTPPADWINTGDEPVTIRTAAVIAWNAGAGRYDLLFWEPVSPEVTLQTGDSFRLGTLRFRLTEVLDG